MAKVSIIIPVLNEADNLPLLFDNINRLNPKPQQVILVDGGSNDDSIAMIRSFINELMPDNDRKIDWQMTESKAGRALQMNTGAALATGEVLLFLHADTQLPLHAIDSVSKAMKRAEWGRFDVQIASRQPTLRLVSQMINWRSRLSGIATGDQAIFISQSLFKQIDGYPNQALMEDVELCKQLKGIAKPACLKSKVITSARRWQQHGTWRTIILMWHLRFDYWRGVSTDNIKARYYK
ncbi:TIGR04283 family arsenosugar biosynthesis glycosyltransferase [Psychrobacter sp. Ps4]|uniref:TIGR04283 family arsenosugar biosynthesis glycosyltransferase n=1 Tax=Psychrobacter sp. Ps4 TaxID=2790958 RepID=UPI001EDEC583|nr:TIGR04283 family arsenosugar biosynthesis glycosyltransferase [Psychrobacter sp. Ps4]MCG3809701.1 TIGR04283 family arsenosugar biosynthesis glycosyltransferase [Psychrobacter sp. Ps4]